MKTISKPSTSTTYIPLHTYMLQMAPDELAPKFALNTPPVPKPLLVMLDETPRAAQTLRFVIDNLIKTPQEAICLLFTLPPCKSTLLKNKVTSRIMSFITLCTEPYTSAALKPNLRLFIVDRVDLLDAIQDLVVQLDPRMFVFGAANVSFAIKGDMDKVLQVGTGAAGVGYYASTYVPQTAPASPVFSSAGSTGIASRDSYSSLGAPAVGNTNGGRDSADLEQQYGSSPSSVNGENGGFLGALWTSLAAVRRASAATPGHDLQGHVPEGKSAYVVEGAFADAVKEHVSVPVVVVKVTVAV
ncbi:hypothetical protein HDU81_010096 [Chytriomyces hyalinus]|nr:hypothetical protein HDU81_010096 [Chytriomyces hyalinus]